MINDLHDTLLLKRDTVTEAFPKDWGSWIIWDSTLLDINLWCMEGIKLPGEPIDAEDILDFSLHFTIPPMEPEDIRPGLVLKSADHPENRAIFSRPKEYRDELLVTNSTLEVLSRDGDRLLCKLTGDCSGAKRNDASEDSFSLEATVWLETDGGMRMKAEILSDFLALFPEHRTYFRETLNDYGYFPDHIFYEYCINHQLTELLRRNDDEERIRKYVNFIEHMWRDGDVTDVNVVNVTILEYLSDHRGVWRCLGTYISEEFRDYINNDVLLHNIAMRHVAPI